MSFQLQPSVGWEQTLLSSSRFELELVELSLDPLYSWLGGLSWKFGEETREQCNFSTLQRTYVRLTFLLPPVSLSELSVQTSLELEQQISPRPSQLWRKIHVWTPVQTRESSVLELSFAIVLHGHSHQLTHQYCRVTRLQRTCHGSNSTF